MNLLKDTNFLPVSMKFGNVHVMFMYMFVILKISLHMQAYTNSRQLTVLVYIVPGIWNYLGPASIYGLVFRVSNFKLDEET